MTTHRPWASDWPVSLEIVQRLIARWFPDLPADEARWAGEGWDNVVVRVGDWLVRVPRRRFGAEVVEHEIAALTWLDGRLSLPTPRPVATGGPDPELPARFFVYRRLEGASSDAVASHSARSGLVAPLARFLDDLHALDVDEARRAGVPEDTFRGDVARSLATARRHLDALADRAHLAGVRDTLERLWLRLSARCWPPATSPPCVLHGDLHARHLLLRADPLTITGVIDWGDVCLGDPAVDLRVGWLWLDPQARGELFEQVLMGRPDDVTLPERARVHALKVVSALLSWADDLGDASMLAEATHAAAALAVD